MPRLPRRAGLVREPVQVYLEPDDSALLSRLAEEAGMSKAEILRRGIKSFAREQQGAVAPMLRFLTESSAGPWPSGVAADHDAALADSYLALPKKRR